MRIFMYYHVNEVRDYHTKKANYEMEFFVMFFRTINITKQTKRQAESDLPLDASVLICRHRPNGAVIVLVVPLLPVTTYQQFSMARHTFF